MLPDGAMDYIARMPQERRAARRKVPHHGTDTPFGHCIARRLYFWQPPVGHRRQVVLEIGTRVIVGSEEWACPFRVTGLPKEIDTAPHGSDAVQGLELALVANSVRRDIGVPLQHEHR